MITAMLLQLLWSENGLSPRQKDASPERCILVVLHAMISHKGRTKYLTCYMQVVDGLFSGQTQIGLNLPNILTVYISTGLILPFYQ